MKSSIQHTYLLMIYLINLIFNYKYIEKNTFFTDYKNKDVNDDFVLNYLNIIKTYKTLMMFIP